MCLRRRGLSRRSALTLRLGILLLVGFTPSGSLSFIERIFVRWLSESWKQKCCGRFCWRPLRFGGGGRFGWRPPWLGRRAVLLLNYILAFALQLRKITENLSQGSPVVTGLFFANLADFWRTASAGLLHVSSPQFPGGLLSALGRHKCLPGCRSKGFPPSAKFELKPSVSALMRSARNGIPKSSWISLLPTYQGVLVTVRRHLDCKTQLSDMAAGNGPPDRTYVIRHRTDELLVEQHTVPDGQTASPCKEGASHAQSLSCLLSHLVDVCRPS
jgi:hypothetical protein